MSTIRLQLKRLDTYELFPISRSFKFGGASEVAIVNDAERFRLQAAWHRDLFTDKTIFFKNMIFQSPEVIKPVKQDPKVASRIGKVWRESVHSCGRN